MRRVVAEWALRPPAGLNLASRGFRRDSPAQRAQIALRHRRGVAGCCRRGQGRVEGGRSGCRRGIPRYKKEGKEGKDEAYCRVAAAVDSAALRLPELPKPILFQLLCHFSQYKGWEPGSARAGKASEAAGKKAAKRPRGAAEAAGKKAAKRPRA